MLWSIFYCGYCVYVLFHSFFLGAVGIGSWSGSTEMWSWFAVLSLFRENKRQACVLLSFSPYIYSGLNHSPPPEPNLSASVNKCERLEIVLRVLGWQYWTQVTWVGVGLKTVCMCPTHSEIGFQLWGGGEQRAIMPVRMCWLFSALCLLSPEHTRRENDGVGMF